VLLQHRDAHHRRRQIPADESPLLVNQEHAVRVAVEGGTEIAALLHDDTAQFPRILRLNGVGLVVREGSVQLEVERHDFAREMGKHLRHGETRHAVARINRNLERPNLARVNEREQVGRVVVEDVALREVAAFCFFGRWEVAGHDEVANLANPVSE